jgi:hypothetical protein
VGGWRLRVCCQHALGGVRGGPPPPPGLAAGTQLNTETHAPLPLARRATRTAQGFRGRGGSTTQRLDGAIYAASNAALMLAQLGEEEGALAEVCASGRLQRGVEVSLTHTHTHPPALTADSRVRVVVTPGAA